MKLQYPFLKLYQKLFWVAVVVLNALNYQLPVANGILWNSMADMFKSLKLDSRL